MTSSNYNLDAFMAWKAGDHAGCLIPSAGNVPGLMVSGRSRACADCPAILTADFAAIIDSSFGHQSATLYTYQAALVDAPAPPDPGAR